MSVQRNSMIDIAQKGFIAALSGLLCLPVGFAASLNQATHESLLARLAADYQALEQARHDFHSQQQHGALSKEEVVDFHKYLEQLGKRVADDCKALANTGYDMNEQPICADQTNPHPQAPPTGQAQAHTRDELLQQQDGQLSQQLGEFDEMLLREQARVKAATPQASAAANADQHGGQDDGQANGASQPATYNAKVENGTLPSSPGQQTLGQGGGAKEAKQTAVIPVPADIPDGSDDDLVARQLREAAEQETDPVLREKLWDEYRKYKQGI